MFPENETVMVILGAGVLVFILRTRPRFRHLRSWHLLVLAYCLILVGWCATLVEHVTGSDFFNYLEHTAYVVGALIVALWCWGGMGATEEAD